MGELRPVAGTAFDIRRVTEIGERLRDRSDDQLRLGHGYDHNWVVSRAPAPGPRLVARLEDPAPARVLEVLSAEQGLQVYSASFLDGSVRGKRGQLYQMGDTVCLEPQRFPDTPNRPAFGTALLASGETYHPRMIFPFSAA